MTITQQTIAYHKCLSQIAVLFSVCASIVWGGGGRDLAHSMCISGDDRQEGRRLSGPRHCSCSEAEMIGRRAGDSQVHAIVAVRKWSPQCVDSFLEEIHLDLVHVPDFGPRREAGDVWCLPPVWNLRAVVWFHFAITSLVLLTSPVTLSVLSFSACWPFLLNFFQKILQYFSLRDRLFCMAPV